MEDESLVQALGQHESSVRAYKHPPRQWRRFSGGGGGGGIDRTTTTEQRSDATGEVTTMTSVLNER
jgi:hypothetical protein